MLGQAFIYFLGPTDLCWASEESGCSVDGVEFSQILPLYDSGPFLKIDYLT